MAIPHSNTDGLCLRTCPTPPHRSRRTAAPRDHPAQQHRGAAQFRAGWQALEGQPSRAKKAQATGSNL